MRSSSCASAPCVDIICKLFERHRGSGCVTRLQAAISGKPALLAEQMDVRAGTAEHRPLRGDAAVDFRWQNKSDEWIEQGDEMRIRRDEQAGELIACDLTYCNPQFCLNISRLQLQVKHTHDPKIPHVSTYQATRCSFQLADVDLELLSFFSLSLCYKDMKIYKLMFLKRS